ncbi:MAG: TolC family protein [Clostridiaceae bacterium]
MKKNVAIICSIIILLLSFQTSAAENVTSKIALEDVIKNALSSNSSIQLFNNKIIVAERKYNSAVSKASDFTGKVGYTSEERINNAKIQFLAPLQRLAELNELIWNKQEYEKELKLDITELYYQLLLLDQKFQNQKDVIDRVKLDLDIKNKQVKIGTVLAYDLLPLEIAVDEAELRAIDIQREIDKLVMDLNIKMGFDIYSKWVLINRSLPEVDFIITKIDDTVASVVSTSHSILKLEEEKMLIDKELELNIGYAIKETPDTVEALREKSNNLKYSIKDERISVEYRVRSDYNNLLNLLDDVKIAKLDYDMSEKLLAIAQVKYDKGLISNFEYQRLVGERDASQLAYNQAKLNYYLAVENFKTYIGHVEK